MALVHARRRFLAGLVAVVAPAAAYAAAPKKRHPLPKGSRRVGGSNSHGKGSHYVKPKGGK